MKCDDPYWSGCKKPAAFKRVQKDNHNLDEPMYLCEEYYVLRLNDENFREEEWVKMIY